MLKERLHFLKKTFLLSLFMILMSFLCVFGTLTMLGFYELAKVVFLIIISIFILTQVFGYWRLSVGYFGMAVVLFSSGVFCVYYLLMALLLKPGISNSIGIYLGVFSPYSYMILLIYFSTILFILYKELFENCAKGYNVFLTYKQDIDKEKQFVFLDYSPNKAIQGAIKLSPKKKAFSMWLTVVTQVFLIKMSWDNPGSAIIAVVSFSLIGMVCLIIGVGLFRAVLYEIKYEKSIGFHSKLALRKSFSLKSFIQQSQQNSY